MVDILKRVLGLEQELINEQREALETEIDKQLVERRRDEVEERARQLRTAEELRGLRHQMDRSLQWEIAMGLVELFIQECFEEATSAEDHDLYRWPGEHALKVAFRKGGESAEADPLYPLRERYVIYVFNRVCDCSEKRQKILDFDDFLSSEHDYAWARDVGALLEGVAIQRGESAGFPDLKAKTARQLIEEEDLSSWQGELYLATTDNALIYCKSVDKSHSLVSDGMSSSRCERGRCNLSSVLQEIHFPHRPSKYHDYWLCIVRGIEYIIGLRLMAHLVARETTGHLAEIAEMEKQAGDPAIVPDARRLHEQVTTMTRLLSRLRDAATPMFIATADYATRKFDHLINTSGMPTVLDHAESNIQQINAFLQHHENMMAQRRVEQLTGVFSVVGLVLYLLALPSFIIDWEKSSWGHRLGHHGGPGAVLAVQVCGVLLPFLVGLVVWLVLKRRWRR